MKSLASEPGLRRSLLSHPTVSVRVCCVQDVYLKWVMSRYCYRLSLHQLNSKNNGPGLFFQTIFCFPVDCFYERLGCMWIET